MILTIEQLNEITETSLKGVRSLDLIDLSLTVEKTGDRVFSRSGKSDKFFLSEEKWELVMDEMHYRDEADNYAVG